MTQGETRGLIKYKVLNALERAIERYRRPVRATDVVDMYEELYEVRISSFSVGNMLSSRKYCGDIVGKKGCGYYFKKKQ